MKLVPAIAEYCIKLKKRSFWWRWQRWWRKLTIPKPAFSQANCIWYFLLSILSGAWNLGLYLGGFRVQKSPLHMKWIKMPPSNILCVWNRRFLFSIDLRVQFFSRDKPWEKGEQGGLHFTQLASAAKAFHNLEPMV